jgi:hypothetical protein
VKSSASSEPSGSGLRASRYNTSFGSKTDNFFTEKQYLGHIKTILFDSVINPVNTG